MLTFKNLYLLFLVGVNLFSSNKALPLPENEKDIKSTSGSIVHCDIQELGSWGFQIFLGMELDNSEAPYIRFNFVRTELPKYQKWCDNHADISINYRAKSTELRPKITYWGQDIKENKKITGN